MFLIDTSVWINVFRDRTGTVRQSLEAIINNENIIILN
jgi:predicted nucleic acid-binding protein